MSSLEGYFSKAVFKRSYGIIEQLSEYEKPEIVLSGRSNVGKSSLLNRLCFQKSLARESSTPGKTITINFFSLPNAYIVDLPGYGFARRSATEMERFAKLCEGYAQLNNRRRLYLQLIDARRGITPDDLTMLNFLEDSNEAYIAVVTKIGKLNKTEFIQKQREISYELSNHSCNIVFTDAKTSDGYDLLREYVKEFIDEND